MARTWMTAVAGLVALYAGARAWPDVRRYLRIRSM
ncbi:DUF6893 family small protein [Streptomyces lichenis]